MTRKCLREVISKEWEKRFQDMDSNWLILENEAKYLGHSDRLKGAVFDGGSRNGFIVTVSSI